MVYRQNNTTTERTAQSMIFFVFFILIFLQILTKIGQSHITLFQECIVESQSGTHAMRLMSMFCYFKIISKQWTVIWMSTVFYNLFCTTQRSLSSKISNTLLRHNHVN